MTDPKQGLKGKASLDVTVFRIRLLAYPFYYRRSYGDKNRVIGIIVENRFCGKRQRAAPPIQSVHHWKDGASLQER